MYHPHNFYSFQSPGRVYPRPSVHSLSWGCNQSVGWEYKPFEAQPGKDPFPSSLMWLLAEFSFMKTVEGLSSLLAVGWRPPLLPFPMGLSIRQFTAWQLAPLDGVIEKSSRERKKDRKKVRSSGVCILVQVTHKWMKEGCLLIKEKVPSLNSLWSELLQRSRTRFLWNYFSLQLGPKRRR